MKLATRFADLDAVLLPCGVPPARVSRDLKGGLDLAGRIGEKKGRRKNHSVRRHRPGTAVIRPNIDQDDIEGAELAALRGAERTLRRHRPGLAIAIYHKPEDLWEFRLWLAERNLGYRMYVRGHCHVGYDLILYCRAD